MNIDQGDDKGGQGEAAETERTGIRKPAEEPLVGFGVKIDGRSRKYSRLVRLTVFSRGVGETSGFEVGVIGSGGHFAFYLNLRQISVDPRPRIWTMIK